MNLYIFLGDRSKYLVLCLLTISELEHGIILNLVIECVELFVRKILFKTCHRDILVFLKQRPQGRALSIVTVREQNFNCCTDCSHMTSCNRLIIHHIHWHLKYGGVNLFIFS